METKKGARINIQNEKTNNGTNKEKSRSKNDHNEQKVIKQRMKKS